MRKLLLALFLSFSFPTFSQSFGNEWINYNQNYYKFDISENGVYRISFQALINSGFPVQNINPQNLQLFAKGEEVPMYIKGENDGVFDNTDYLEFYGEKNDGWLDTALYSGRQNQPNPYYSLITDTVSYFLTWNTSTNNLRFQEENAIDFSNYFAAPYILKENIQVYNSNYYDGRILSSRATNPEYTASEGWMDQPITLGAVKNKTISTPNRYTAGPFVDFEIQVVGASDWGAVNNGDHHLRITFGSQTVDEIFEGYELKRINRSFSPTEIIRGNNTIRFESIDDRGVGVDRTALAYMKITYPHTVNVNFERYYEFLLDDASAQSAQYLEMLSFNGGSEAILYDLTNRKKIKVVETLSNHKMIIPNGSSRKRCVILNPTEVKSIGRVFAVNDGTAQFTNLSASAADSAFMIITATELLSGASAYEIYRQSKGKNTMLVNVDELYDQYAFGLNKHPLAIRNFIDKALTDWAYPPTHLFLVGKSVSVKEHRKSTSAVFNDNLVPSFGNPAADNLLIAGLQGTNLETPIPIGRLSANNLNEIDIYLDKVIEYEAAPQEKWMKKALHFAGGKSFSETNVHKGYLNGYANDFEGENYGGKSFLFEKNTSAPFQTSLADSVRGLINSGVSIMTFFGHSSATGGFDISIDSPDRLNNKGRYPVLLGNSCFAGNYHQYGVRSTSEEYVIERDAGVIAFIANGNLGVGTFLNTYSSAFYDNLSDDFYGKSLAEIMRQTVKDVQTVNTPELLKNVCIEMALQGDPAIVMNAAGLPDYEVKETNVEVQPEEVTTDLSTFKTFIRIDNVGKAVADSVVVQLTREYPLNGKTDSTITLKVAPINYESFVEYELEIDVLNAVGENKFTLIVDPLNEVFELDESNNRVDFTVLIRSGEIIPVYPYNYSIVGRQSPTLSASTAFAFEEEKNYVFELDESIDFDSPAKQTTTVLSTGGVISWQPPSLSIMSDSAVYYWRVSRVPAAGEVFNWRTFSFQYINNESGFSQDDFDQFNANEYLFLNQNQSNNQFQFTNKAQELGVVTYGTPTVTEYNNVLYRVDNDIRERQTCEPQPAFLIAVLDSLSLESWMTPFAGQNSQNNFGQANVNAWCSGRNRSEAVFNFQTRDSVQMDSMKSFLNNKIPDGNYIVVYTWLGVDYAALNARDPSILQAFNNLGSTAINSIQSGSPFIFTAKVGDVGSVREVAGTSASDRIELTRELTTSANFGEMKSVELGPSQSFSRLQYEFTSLETNSDDSVTVELIGVDSAKVESVLLSSQKFSLDTSLLNAIDINKFQNLRLKLNASDLSLQTAPQLKRWQVSFSEIPDAALSPNIFLDVNKDSLQQGELLEFQVAIKNVSQVNLDSLAVSLALLDGRNQIHQLAYNKTAPIAADSVLIYTASIPTVGILGNNRLLIELNPNQEQQEKFVFNNFGQYDFYVGADAVNPLLDVTFDGRHILNREIVSAEPTIAINLQDNNEFLALDDTSAMAIYLRYPSGAEELITYANYPELSFVPAQLPKNEAKVVFNAKLEEDGIYRLRVQAKDKSGNESGNTDFQIEFEVINKSTITHLLNYPNPFSTSTRFVFTLTGSEIPDDIQIQILTITGKVVREIDEFELGPIQIGNNITEFAWDGKDEFGDQLANGVYFYRVKMKLNGENIERRNTAVDKSFVKEFGKMYLLR